MVWELETLWPTFPRHRHGLVAVPPIPGVSSSIARGTGDLSLIVELHHPDLQELAAKEQDQLGLVIGEYLVSRVMVTWIAD